MTNPNQCCYIHDDVCCRAGATLELRWGESSDDYTHACGVHCQQMIADEAPKTIDVTPLVDLQPLIGEAEAPPDAISDARARVLVENLTDASEELLIELCGLAYVEAGEELARRLGSVRTAGEALLPYINSEEVDAMLDAGVGEDPVTAFKAAAGVK